MEPNVGILSFDFTFISTLLFQWLNTGVLAFILYKLLYKPVRGFMQARQERISGQIASAQTQLQDAEALKKDYEQKLKNIELEKAEILDNARKRGAEREAQIIEAAKEEARSIKQRAELEVQREKDKAQDEMRRQIIELSSIMATRYVKTQMDKDLGAKLLDMAISDLGDVKWPN